jgi:hypothetical protein
MGQDRGMSNTSGHMICEPNFTSVIWSLMTPSSQIQTHIQNYIGKGWKKLEQVKEREG